MTTPGGTEYEVELVESEVVRGRGAVTTLWFFRKGESWAPVSEHPSATVEALDPGPGTVWERRVTLRLAEGSRLLRHDGRPAKAVPRDALDYLEGGPRRAARRARREEFRVGRRGRLARVEGG